MNRLHAFLATLASALALSSPALGAPIAFSVKSDTFIADAGYGTDASEVIGTRLDVVFAANGTTHAAILAAPGQSFSFDFGTVTLNESGNIRAAETDDLGVSAVFVFQDPFVGLRTVSATGTATSGPIVDVAIDLSIDWQPLVVGFGDGGLFSITMDALNFRQTGATRTQTATITLLRQPNEIPEPASLTLAALALAGGLVASRRRARH